MTTLNRPSYFTEVTTRIYKQTVLKNDLFMLLNKPKKVGDVIDELINCIPDRNTYFYVMPTAFDFDLMRKLSVDEDQYYYMCHQIGGGILDDGYMFKSFIQTYLKNKLVYAVTFNLNLPKQELRALKSVVYTLENTTPIQDLLVGKKPVTPPIKRKKINHNHIIEEYI